MEDLPPFNFGLKNVKYQPPVVAEESKVVKSSNNQKVSMSQFMRNVSSKRDLTYALEVKGKINFLLIILVYFRSNILAGKAILYSRLPEGPT